MMIFENFPDPQNTKTPRIWTAFVERISFLSSDLELSAHSKNQIIIGLLNTHKRFYMLHVVCMHVVCMLYDAWTAHGSEIPTCAFGTEPGI